MSSLTDLVDLPDGYSIIDIPASLRKIAESVIAGKLKSLASRPGLDFDTLLSDIVNGTNFDAVKDKAFRMFDAESVENLKAHDFCKRLFVEDGSLFISDEENLGYPNIYWRIVRAGSASDVGPVHADYWFWDLGHGSIPPSYRRVKMWIPLRQDQDHVGLLIGPGTHRMDFRYDKVFKDGKYKPVFERGPVEHLLIPAPVRVGQAVVFHDRLLHGGEVSPRKLRLSMELTWVMRDDSSDGTSPALLEPRRDGRTSL
jgi:hypothetical protein